MFTELYQHKKTIQAADVGSTPKCLTLRVGTDNIEALISTEAFTKPETLTRVQFQAEAFNSANTQAFDHFCREQGFGKTPFDRCRVILVSSDFTLVPSAFGAQTAIKALNLVNGRNQNRHLQMHLPGINIVAGFDAEWLNAIERHFPNAQIKHCAAVTLSLFENHHSLSKADMFLLLNGSDMELCARNEKGLLFYNIFKPQSDEDVLYYLLFAIEQFELKPEQLKLAMAADTEANGSLISSIKKYVRNLNLVAHAPNLQLTGDFSKLPAHFYFQLLNQHLCE